MLTAADVLDAKFAGTKLRQGYDQDEVDDFLDRVAETLTARETREPTRNALTAAEVEGVRFRATRWREGYDQQQVDEFLGKVRETLA
jgi:DivIVA domain-containing protein